MPTYDYIVVACSACLEKLNVALRVFEHGISREAGLRGKANEYNTVKRHDWIPSPTLRHSQARDFVPSEGIPQ